jgi:hypothetical protein
MKNTTAPASNSLTRGSYGPQLEMEEALAGWLRSQITRIEQQLAKSTGLLFEERDEFSKLAET